MRAVLTIAGSDSGGGAGLQADLKTFAAYGVYGASAVTAVTAQNTQGVTAWLAMPADLVTAQIEAVAADIAVDAVKTGMLGSAAIVEAVAAAIEALELPLVVVDPVMVAKSGDSLLEADAIAAIKAELLPRAFVVTPNAAEAEVLSGVRVTSVDAARGAAARIVALGAGAAVVKGGHLGGDEVVDVLFDGRSFHEFSGPRLASRSTHGTGCSFASAIAAGLALGRPLPAAVEDAKAFVAGGIRHAPAIGQGHGPLHHFWRGLPPPGGEPAASPRR